MERLAYVFAVLTTAAGVALVPSWTALGDVCVQAAYFAVLTIAVLSVTRRLGPRGFAFERRWAALFLAGMPLVYVARWFLAGTPAGEGWLAIELAGLVGYGTLAFLGLWHRPALLALGVAGHGLAWDAWHLLGSSYVPRWYAVGCLLVDVGLGAYLLVRSRRWRLAVGVTGS